MVTKIIGRILICKNKEYRLITIKQMIKLNKPELTIVHRHES